MTLNRPFWSVANGLPLTGIKSVGHSTVNACKEFAAQEVAKEIEAYKERLKKAFENADGGDINYIINTVK